MSDRKVLMVRKRHSRDDVVREALALLDEAGIDAVTLRGVARRMGLHLNSVSFQVTSKARLFELMADAILGELSLDQLPSDPRHRIREVTQRFRRALLSHRDGGRVVAGTDTAGVNAHRYAEVIVSAFLELGVSEAVAARASVALHCLVLGLVEEEQTDRPSSPRQGVPAGEYPGVASVGGLLSGDSLTEGAEFGIAAMVDYALLTISPT
jgi:TetR/AcrR family tetracycline transcriptional repressor